MSERLLTAAELGEILGLTAGTVLDRFERGDLPGYRLFGRKGGPVRFRLSDVEAALEGWRVGSSTALGLASSITSGILSSTTREEGGSRDG